jgi:hypothetical protein
MAVKRSRTKPVPTDFRLARILQRRCEEEGGDVPLARAISAANGIDLNEAPNRKPIIDRRKLKRIRESNINLVLSLKELRALDRYLEQFDEGLGQTPLFVKPDILHSIAAAEREVVFVLGSKPEPPGLRFNVSHWDVMAMSDIQHSLYGLSQVRCKIRDMLVSDDVAGARNILRRKEWQSMLGENGPSIVCFGSTRAVHACDSMLSTMFSVPPFESSKPRPQTRLPIRYVWPDGLKNVLPSCFNGSLEELAEIDPKAARAVSRNQASALLLEDEVFVDELLRKESGKTYGVVFAQRRRRGQIWVVVAGITGPATYAAGLMVKGIATRLLDEKKGRDSPVFWAVIGASVHKARNVASGSGYEVEHGEILAGPHQWEVKAPRSSTAGRTGS